MSDVRLPTPEESMVNGRSRLSAAPESVLRDAHDRGVGRQGALSDVSHIH